MNKYEFDQECNRRDSASMKWDVAPNELPMWVADMDFVTAPPVVKALQARAKHGIYGYSVVPDEWYKAIGNWWRRRHGYTILPEWLQFTTGVVPAISCMVQRLTNVGDNVAVLTPAYDIFFHSIENFGRHVAECPLRYCGGQYSVDWDNLERTLTQPTTTMMILCNPHNPTGNVWTRDELARIGELAQKHGVVVLSDEIHCDLTLPGVRYTPFAAASKACADNSITCISASKAFNLAGLQGAAVFAANRNLREIAVRGLNACEVAEPNCFAVDGTVAAFTKGGPWLDKLLDYLAENRRVATEFLRQNAPQAHLVEGQATYLLWIDCGEVTADSDELCAWLREKTGLVLSPGGQYRGNGRRFLRMNVACARERMLDGLHRFVDGLAEYIGRAEDIKR